MFPLSETIASIVGRGIMFGAALLLASLGEIFAQKSGFMNLAMEGLMTLAASVSYQVMFLTGNPALALAAAMASSMAVSFISVYLNQRFYLDQVVAGMALYIFSFGLGVYIHRVVSWRSYRRKIY